ncbi:hypothetical protein VP01_4881g2 [Puccinia sorghi]|uniref:Uncharacterized protein n=1 Tax=Puccinia sorghi TaxID=27349 RepID=A0A0L6UM92_9BASI|nr:hypothetical protein VP01_4881g2 [Puccinia sorghi]
MEGLICFQHEIKPSFKRFLVELWRISTELRTKLTKNQPCAQLKINTQQVSAQCLTNLRERTCMRVSWKQPRCTGKAIHFIVTKNFNNKALNHIIKPYLQAEFHYYEPGASLQEIVGYQFWRNVVLGATGSNSQSIKFNKFNLIHYLWKKKRKRLWICWRISFFYQKQLEVKISPWPEMMDLFFFIYILCHTKESGSNNNKIAGTSHDKFQNLEVCILNEITKKMHIKCFFHKIALLFNTGLNKLGLEAPPPTKLNISSLGNFPYLPTIERKEDQNKKDKANKESKEIKKWREQMMIWYKPPLRKTVCSFPSIFLIVSSGSCRQEFDRRAKGKNLRVSKPRLYIQGKKSKPQNQAVKTTARI